jgi:hypothetical protein
VTQKFLFSMPVVLPAVFLGRAINHRFTGTGFLKYVYGGLALIGAMLFVETMMHRV